MHKRSVVKSLMDRAAKIPTTKSDKIKEKQRVISTLQSNGYPKRFILDASNFKPSVKDTTPLAESVIHVLMAQELRWRNAEKIHNKIKGTPKGCRTATRRKISTCGPRDKNKSRHRVA